MTEILNIALSVLGALVTAAVTALSKVLIGLIKEKIGGEKAKRAAEAAVKAVSASVAATAQTYVDELKKSGSFDAAAQKNAFEKAKAAALSMLSESAKKALTEMYGNLNAYLDAEIESAVRADKAKAA